MTRRDGLLIIDGIGLMACLGMLWWAPDDLGGVKDVILMISGAFAAGLASAHAKEFGP
jgi:hypothetical protein